MHQPGTSLRGLPRSAASGFTLLEVVVASTVFALILGLTVVLINQTGLVTRRASEKISAFQGSRAAFDFITSLVSQATLNSYWDYDDPAAPTRYLRQSELHFLVGKSGTSPFPGTTGTGSAFAFQAPLGSTANPTLYGGLQDLLNACGFYVEYGSAPALPSPPFPAATPVYRYRLMGAIQPAESLQVYSNATGTDWLRDLQTNAVPLTDNIIFMLAWPRKSQADDPVGDSLSDDFLYDSRLDARATTQPETANQLPPSIQITLVAIDEATAARICTTSTPPTQISDLSAGLFANSNRDDFTEDLKTLSDRLSVGGFNFRIFTETVAIRESKME